MPPAPLPTPPFPTNPMPEYVSETAPESAHKFTTDDDFYDDDGFDDDEVYEAYLKTKAGETKEEEPEGGGESTDDKVADADEKAEEGGDEEDEDKKPEDEDDGVERSEDESDNGEMTEEGEDRGGGEETENDDDGGTLAPAPTSLTPHDEGYPARDCGKGCDPTPAPVMPPAPLPTPPFPTNPMPEYVSETAPESAHKFTTDDDFYDDDGFDDDEVYEAYLKTKAGETKEEEPEGGGESTDDKVADADEKAEEGGDEEDEDKKPEDEDDGVERSEDESDNGEMTEEGEDRGGGEETENDDDEKAEEGDEEGGDTSDTDEKAEGGDKSDTDEKAEEGDEEGGDKSDTDEKAEEGDEEGGDKSDTDEKAEEGDEEGGDSEGTEVSKADDKKTDDGEYYYYYYYYYDDKSIPGSGGKGSGGGKGSDPSSSSKGDDETASVKGDDEYLRTDDEAQVTGLLGDLLSDPDSLAGLEDGLQTPPPTPATSFPTRAPTSQPSHAPTVSGTRKAKGGDEEEEAASGPTDDGAKAAFLATDDDQSEEVEEVPDAKEGAQDDGEAGGSGSPTVAPSPVPTVAPLTSLEMKVLGGEHDLWIGLVVYLCEAALLIASWRACVSCRSAEAEVFHGADTSKGQFHKVGAKGTASAAAPEMLRRRDAVQYACGFLFFTALFFFSWAVYNIDRKKSFDLGVFVFFFAMLSHGCGLASLGQRGAAPPLGPIYVQLASLFKDSVLWVHFIVAMSYALGFLLKKTNSFRVYCVLCGCFWMLTGCMVRVLAGQWVVAMQAVEPEEGDEGGEQVESDPPFTGRRQQEAAAEKARAKERAKARQASNKSKAAGAGAVPETKVYKREDFVKTTSDLAATEADLEYDDKAARCPVLLTETCFKASAAWGESLNPQ